MASICKIVRTAINPRVKTTLLGHRYSSCYSTDACGGKSDKQYLLGPSSGDSNNPGAPTMYDSRKLGHKLSTDGICPSFETLNNIPTGVFRCTTGEVLGRGAAKVAYYQNPEYFSYHHMSFYDLNIGLRQYRIPCPKSGRKPV